MHRSWLGAARAFTRRSSHLWGESWLALCLKSLTLRRRQFGTVVGGLGVSDPYLEQPARGIGEMHVVVLKDPLSVVDGSAASRDFSVCLVVQGDQDYCGV